MTSFSTHCQEVVKEYVQTVMIIDDGAGLNSEPLPVTITDTPLASNPFMADFIQAPPPEQISNPEPSKVFHRLDTLELTNAFFEKGIVAGIYQPKIDNSQQPEEFAEQARSACEKADIIILDWILKDRNSVYSKAIVKEILQSDFMGGGRIRAIMIYTGESKLNSLRDELCDYLSDYELNKNVDFEIRAKNLIISFYNKNHEGYAFSPDRAVRESEIPKVALSSFAILVQGLTPIFAMKSAATVRKNTGRIISRFDSSLDTAYLAHRVLLPEPQDSEVFMLENFVSYTRNILAISRVDNLTLGDKSIEFWIKENNDKLDKKIKNEQGEYSLELDELIQLAQIGFSKKLYSILENKKEEICKPFKDTSNTPSLNAIKIFNSDKSDVIESSIELSILSSFRRTFKDIAGANETPYLTQGSLIYSKTKDLFLLCITPKCDTVRIEKEQKFSFVVLNEAPGKKFDIIIPENRFVNANKDKFRNKLREQIVYSLIDYRDLDDKDEIKLKLNEQLKTINSKEYSGYIYLRTTPKFHELEHINFESDDKKRIPSNNRCPDLIEFWDSEFNEYIWIGDLHDLNTIYRVGNLVSNLNRTGTDEVEWLRRHYQ